MRARQGAGSYLEHHVRALGQDNLAPREIPLGERVEGCWLLEPDQLTDRGEEGVDRFAGSRGQNALVPVNAERNRAVVEKGLFLRRDHHCPLLRSPRVLD
eukprot:2225420-Rhodomonas_salina.1